MKICEFTERFLKAIPSLIRKGHSNIFTIVAKSGLTLQQFLTLEFLRLRESVKMSDLAKCMNISSAAVTKLVDKLEKGSFIKRKPSAEDRRVIFLKITKKGDNLVTKVNEERAKVVRAGFCKLSSEERESYINIIEKVNGILSSEEEKQ